MKIIGALIIVLLLVAYLVTMGYVVSHPVLIEAVFAEICNANRTVESISLGCKKIEHFFDVLFLMLCFTFILNVFYFFIMKRMRR